MMLFEFTKNKKLLSGSDRLFFLSSMKDNIKGKTQLIFEKNQRIKLINKLKKTKIDNYGNQTLEIINKFMDENFDKRGKVFSKESLSYNYYLYKLIINYE